MKALGVADIVDEAADFAAGVVERALERLDAKPNDLERYI